MITELNESYWVKFNKNDCKFPEFLNKILLSYNNNTNNKKLDKLALTKNNNKNLINLIFSALEVGSSFHNSYWVNYENYFCK